MAVKRRRTRPAGSRWPRTELTGRLWDRLDARVAALEMAVANMAALKAEVVDLTGLCVALSRDLAARVGAIGRVDQNPVAFRSPAQPPLRGAKRGGRTR